MAVRTFRTEADFALRTDQIEREQAEEGRRLGKRTAVTVDSETGERLEGVAVIVKRKTPHEYKDWAAMSQSAIIEVATDKTLRPETLRVFLFLVGIMRFENFVPVCQAEVATAMGMKRPNVNRAFGDLVARCMIEKGAKIGGNIHEYRVAPNIAWKGRSSNLVKAMRKWGKDVAAAQTFAPANRAAHLAVIEGGARG